MKIALASPPFPRSLEDGLKLLDTFLGEASAKGANIVCFPESFLPGYPGMGYSFADRSRESLQKALERARVITERCRLAVVLPMDAYVNGALMNLAYVIDKDGELLGYQTKNQLDPSEDQFWVPGDQRQIFQTGQLKFGITICHEGFRYPESVRWSALHQAHLVFHPHFNGDDEKGSVCSMFFAKENPYYEKAMMMRALENGIFFASVNYASKYQESASAVFAPDGACLAHQAYGEAGITLVDIDPEQATGIYARRFRPELYRH